MCPHSHLILISISVVVVVVGVEVLIVDLLGFWQKPEVFCFRSLKPGTTREALLTIS